MGTELLGPIFSMMGGVAGNVAGSGYWNDAQKAQKSALEAIANLNAPNDMAQAIQLQQYQNAGQMSPALMQAVQQLASQASNIQEDPSLRNNQMSVLQQLQQLSKTGANAQDRLNFNQAQTQAGADNMARQNAILASMRAQGMGSSGAALAARLQSAQGSANAENQASMTQAANASQRALQALSQYGTMSGDVRNQDYNNAMNKAAAADQMNRFNVQNQLSQNQYNTNALNQAQQYNLANKQNTLNMNTQQNNQELYNQKQREQQQFQDQLNLGQVKGGAYQKASENYNEEGDKQAKQWSDTFKGMGQVGGSMGGMF